MHLDELFNSRADLKFSQDDEDVDYHAQLSDGSYLKIMFAYAGFDGVYECTFARGRRSDYADSSFTKTGMGNEAEVFGVVIQAIQKFMVDYDPSEINFTADKTPDDGNDPRAQSRTSLYARMVGRIKNPDYIVKTKRYSGFDEYQIIKKDTDAHTASNKFDDAFGDDLT